MGRIALHGIRKSYGAVDVLKGIDLTIEEGELAVFVGPSGCGKSTLLRMIAGLDRPTSGTIEINGADVTARGAADRGLAMVFQSYALYPHMTVRANMAFGLENTRMAKAEIAERIAEAARLLEIEPLLERRPGQLSGGQRQRVAIGRAIVRRPTAFLLDEPLSNLDAELRVSMRAELSALHDRLGATMIHVTHDQVEAMTMADRIVVLRAGKVEQVDTPLNLFNHPANLFVAGFIGAPGMNLWSATGENGGVRLDSGAHIALPGAALPNAAKLTVGLRPQHLRQRRVGGDQVRHVMIAGQRVVRLGDRDHARRDRFSRRVHVIQLAEDDRLGAAVLEDEPDRVSAGGIVDRCRDQAGRDDREVRNEPLSRVLAEDCDDVAFLQAKRTESGCKAQNLVMHLRPCLLSDHAVDGLPKVNPVRGFVRPFAQQLIGHRIGGFGHGNASHAPPALGDGTSFFCRLLQR